MEKALAPLRERLRKVRPWAGVAIVAAVVLVGYAGLQGRTYLTATSDEDAAVARLAQLTNVVRQLNDAVGSDEEAAKAKREADVETRKSVLQDWKDEFHVSGYPTTTDPLLGTVFDVATRSGVGLNQINIMEPETYYPGEESTFEYHSQKVGVVVEAESHGDIYRFLSLLHVEMPSVRVEAISLTGFGGADPAADVVLEFHISPHPPPEEEEEAG